MTFQEWIDTVDRVLVAKKAFYRVKDVDPVALQDAYDRGDSPIVFGKLPKHPMRGSADPGFRATTRVSSFVIVGCGIFAGLLAFYVGRGLLRDREGARIALEGPFPRRLPYETGYGMYTPPDAEEALEVAKDEIARQMMLRSSATFDETTVDKILAPGLYEISGEVEARNKYGARLSSPFEARSLKRIEGIGFKSGFGGGSMVSFGPGMNVMGGPDGWSFPYGKRPKVGEWIAAVRMDRGIGDSQMDRGTGAFNQMKLPGRKYPGVAPRGAYETDRASRGSPGFGP